MHQLKELEKEVPQLRLFSNETTSLQTRERLRRELPQRVRQLRQQIEYLFVQILTMMQITSQPSEYPLDYQRENFREWVPVAIDRLHQASNELNNYDNVGEYTFEGFSLYESGYHEGLLYIINGITYDATTLNHYSEEAECRLYTSLPKDVIETFTSNPVLFGSAEGRYVIFTTQDNTLIPVVVFDKKIFTKDEENFVVPLKLPNISYSLGDPLFKVTIQNINNAPVILPKPLPAFNERILQMLESNLNQSFGTTLQQLFQEGFEIKLPIFEDIVFKRTEWHLEEQYHSIVPISEEYRTIYNDLDILNRIFISFDEAILKFQHNEIQRWNFDPSLQAQTKAPNSILTLFGTNGLNYLVKVRHNPSTNQILPPI